LSGFAVEIPPRLMALAGTLIARQPAMMIAEIESTDFMV
jgi:hypothetical protein